MFKQLINLGSQVAKKRSISMIHNRMTPMKSMSTRNSTQLSQKTKSCQSSMMLDSSIMNMNKRSFSSSSQEAVTFVGTNDSNPPQQPVDVQAEVASDEDFFFATRQMTPREGLEN